MTTDISCIVFSFDPYCPSCGRNANEGGSDHPIQMGVVDIIRECAPICENCYEELTILQTCEVRA